MAETTEITPNEREKSSSAEENFLNYGGRTDYLLMAVSILMLAISHFVDSITLSWICIANGFFAVSCPFVIRILYKRCRFSAKHAIKILKSDGCDVKSQEDKIVWIFNGKTNMLQVFNGGLICLSREYNIDQLEDLEYNSKACIRTTSQVHTVKVEVKRDNAPKGQLLFYSSSLCPTASIFKKVYKDYLRALDAAEECQQANLKEIVETTSRQRKKIGFCI